MGGVSSHRVLIVSTSVIYVSGGAAFRNFELLKQRSTVAAGIS
jgi:hypothetical protein